MLTAIRTSSLRLIIVIASLGALGCEEPLDEGGGPTNGGASDSGAAQSDTSSAMAVARAPDAGDVVSSDSESASQDDQIGAEPGGISDAGLASCLTDSNYDAFARQFFEERCNYCHSVGLDDVSRVGAPVGVDFDTEDAILSFATAIRVRVIEEQTMPLGVVLSECELNLLSSYLDVLNVPECRPQCDDRMCGSDACGGSCGVCSDKQSCVADTGQCEASACIPNCAGKSCGDDGCGDACGDCARGLACSNQGTCECQPDCEDKACGDDGCGRSCGACADNEICSTGSQCECLPDCSDRACGDDGCGGSCGACPAGLTCTAGGTDCECVPDCSNAQCGSDGCGGSCGDCRGALSCDTRQGRCVANCSGSCDGRVCGDDGCGTTCGECTAEDYCDASGACVCQPNCLGRSCGNDGCGGSCGECVGSASCGAAGQCACEPSCGDNECGADGCGGSCGACSGGLTCVAGTCSELCIPDCSGSECGDDGCGGSCGACGESASCDQGRCGWPKASFGANVYPILSASGCGTKSCHGGARPAQSLDLSNAGNAFDALVGQDSTQCGARKLVAPEQPDASYLIHKVTGTQLCSGSKMPKTGSGLSASDVDTLRAWIGGGANP